MSKKPDVKSGLLRYLIYGEKPEPAKPLTRKKMDEMAKRLMEKMVSESTHPPIIMSVHDAIVLDEIMPSGTIFKEPVSEEDMAKIEGDFEHMPDRRPGF